MTQLFLLMSMWLCAVPSASDYYRITVVDEETGRGVPMVELETTNNIRFYTDSNGEVAFFEPGLMDQDVFFNIRSHGYEYKKDGFGITGARLKTHPGDHARLKIKRINIAQRVYRITGGGIYRDSVLLGLPVPISQPLLNTQVFGQDSILTAVYRGKLYCFWGDTNWISYPLGNFNTTGATTTLPAEGGLDPDRGVDLNYFARPNGFSKEMSPVAGPGPTWIGPALVVKSDGKERMLTPYNKIKPASLETYERGLCEWNDAMQVFEKLATWDLKHPASTGGAAMYARSRDGDHIYFCTPFPMTRIRPDAKQLADPANFEMYTCLKEGTRLEEGQFDRDDQGRLRYSWKRNTPIVNQREQQDLAKAGRIKSEEGLIQLADVETGRAVMAHGGSVYWNAYRKKWVAIFVEIGGTSSMLGEVWFAEAPTPLGPWVGCRKVATHDRQTFYNPLQHPYFAKDGGRFIFFEGTFCNTFSGNPYQTPRYDYNQMMYKLDLADPRLRLDSKRTTTQPAMAADLERDWHMEQTNP